jgi:lysine N6-hydroxylase
MLRFVDGEEDLIALCPNREVTDVGKAGSGWDIAMANNHAPGTVERVRADVIVWATGFRPGRMDFLAPLAGRLEREGDEYRIDRDFAVCWDAPPDRSIFVQNAARQQRGLADPNLSLLAWRSQRIVDRMCGSRTTEQLASFIQWGTGQPIDALRAA